LSDIDEFSLLILADLNDPIQNFRTLHNRQIQRFVQAELAFEAVWIARLPFLPSFYRSFR
jgi:hypothetical protein